MRYRANDRRGLVRITAAERKKLGDVLFRRYPRREWGSFFRFGYRLTSWGIHISVVDLLPPQLGDLKEESPIVEFNPRYILRAQRELANVKLGIGVVHSHPFGCSTAPSALDDDMDRYFANEFGLYGDGRPYASLRVALHDNEVAFSGEAWVNGRRVPITDLLTVGECLERNVAENVFSEGTHGTSFVTRERTARISELLGSARAGKLRNCRVGIIGCSGTGSPAIEVLARAGVRKFVLVDPKRFGTSNLERTHGSRWRDCITRPYKVKIARRHVLEIDRTAEVIAICGNILDEEVIDELLRCDIVLGCTDSQHSRAALGDFAIHHLLPTIDVGVMMSAVNGVLKEQVVEIARYTPIEPCPYCLGKINQKILSYELLSEADRETRQRAAIEAEKLGIDGAQYWGGTPPKELTVGYLTTAVAAIQAGYAEGMITGAFSMPHQRFQFDIGMPQFGFAPADRIRKPHCQCNRTIGWGDQARADRSVTRPPHWQKPKFLA